MGTDISMPVEFDWVRARSQCSLNVVFKELHNSVQNDVRTMESILPPNRQVKLSVTAFDRVRFSVVREGDDSFSDSVNFTLANGAIIAEDDDKTFQHIATLTLNNEGKCKLTVGNDELDQWQFRRKALEKLFFAPRRS
jgi:hypothetical protein